MFRTGTRVAVPGWERKARRFATLPAMEWRLLVDEALPGAWNMAVDEAVVEAVDRGGSPPVLRVYRWSPGLN